MTVLITGYGPFQEHPDNPSGETAKSLNGKVISGQEIKALQLPVNVRENIRLVKKAIDIYKPSVVIGLGAAPGRSVITPEKFGVNWLDLPEPDIGQNQPKGERIIPEGPEAYQSTLPVSAIVRKIRKAGIPSAVSYSGGTHGCNQILYWILHYLAEKKMDAKAGFIHLPYSHEQVANMSAHSLTMYPPSMSLDSMVRAVEAAVQASLETQEDVEAGLGVMC